MMNLIPWRQKRSNGESEMMSPTEMRREMIRAMERFMDEGFSSWGSGQEPGFSRLGQFVPALDITETDREVTIKAELPGVDPRNVEVTVSGNMLMLSGQKEESEEDRGRGYYRSERTFGSFRRRIELPEFVDPSQVSADYENGVLKVHLQKKQDVQPKKIPVSVGGTPGQQQPPPRQASGGQGKTRS